MAILRKQELHPRLPEIGRIRKGGPKRDRQKEGGTTYQIFGEDLNHFRFEPAQPTFSLSAPDNNGTLGDYLIRQFAELGEEPRTIPIQFLHNELEKNFSAINEVWAKVGAVERCVRRCDGETVKLSMTADKKLSREPQPCATPEGSNECPFKCKPTGRLSFVMPQLKYPGLVVMTTHSLYDILEIQGNLALYEGWDLSKIPFQLCRTEKTITRNDNGSVSSLKKWLCHLVIDPRFGNALLQGSQRQYLAQLEGSIIDSEVIDDPYEPALMLPPESKVHLANEVLTIAAAAGIDKEQLAVLAKQQFGVESTSALTVENLRQLRTELMPTSTKN